MSEIAIRHISGDPVPTTLTNEQLKYIANSEFVPTGLRGNLPAILACVATGRELGIGDLTALRSIHIIEGKASFSAELMVQLVRKRGHSITGEVTEGTATVRGTRSDNGDTMEVTWTTEMAARAGLLGKGNWKKYPESMLWARAASQLCRMLFADCFAGGTYTTEELGADDTGPHAAPYVDQAEGTPFADWDDDPDDFSSPVLPSVGGEPQAVTTATEGSSVPASPATPDEPASPPAEPLFISDPQRRLLFATANDAGVDTPTLKALLRELTGQESTRGITRDVFDSVLAAVQAREVSA